MYVCHIYICIYINFWWITLSTGRALEIRINEHYLCVYVHTRMCVTDIYTHMYFWWITNSKKKHIQHSLQHTQQHKTATHTAFSLHVFDPSH